MESFGSTARNFHFDDIRLVYFQLCVILYLISPLTHLDVVDEGETKPIEPFPLKLHVLGGILDTVDSTHEHHDLEETESNLRLALDALEACPQNAKGQPERLWCVLADK